MFCQFYNIKDLLLFFKMLLNPIENEVLGRQLGRQLDRADYESEARNKNGPVL